MSVLPITSSNSAATQLPLPQSGGSAANSKGGTTTQEVEQEIATLADSGMYSQADIQRLESLAETNPSQAQALVNSMTATGGASGAGASEGSA